MQIIWTRLNNNYLVLLKHIYKLSLYQKIIKNTPGTTFLLFCILLIMWIWYTNIFFICFEEKLIYEKKYYDLSNQELN